MRGSVFAFESFLMAGGWLVFGNAQELWTGGRIACEHCPQRSEDSAPRGECGSEATAKLVLRTLKNTSQITVLNPRSETLVFLKSSL